MNIDSLYFSIDSRINIIKIMKISTFSSIRIMMYLIIIIIPNTLVCVYPSPTHSLIQTKKKQNNISKHNTISCENSRRDWQNIKIATRKTGSKSAFIVHSPKCKRFTDSIDGYQWEVSLPFVDCSD